MNKSLTKHDSVVTPFLATKDWRLSNVLNEDLLLMESGNTVALEFGDYLPIFSIANASCSIALEQQEADKARYREGLKTTGIFYPDEDPVNIDSTFKRIVYSQVKTMFYNAFRDPTKIWGVENIDFEKSKIKRFLSEKFKLFDVPVMVFGEKILENTVEINDTSTDNNYLIKDDGNGNLIAFSNLFSRQQEIGLFDNVFLTGSITGCNSYLGFECPAAPSNLSASQLNVTSSYILLTWNDNSDNEVGFVVERSTGNTSSFAPIIYTGVDVTSAIDTTTIYDVFYFYRVYAYNYNCNSSASNIASISASFLSFIEDEAPMTINLESGSLDTVVFITSGSDTGSVNVLFAGGSVDAAPPKTDFIDDLNIAFYSGSLPVTTLITSGSDTGSVNVLFLSGSTNDTVLITSGSDTGSLFIDFFSGSVQTTVLITSGSDTGSLFINLYSGSLQVFTVTTSIYDTGSSANGSLFISFLNGNLTP